MLEYDIHYSLGKRTFVYMYIQYAWWITALAAGITYLGWQFAYGSAGVWLAGFLDGHPDWFLDTYIVTLMTFLIAFSTLFIGFLRAYVMFRQYKFTVDGKAFHLRRGLFRIREIRVPYMQISSINIEQPYHYRMLGLAQLDVLMNTDSGVARTMSSHKKKNEQFFLIPLIDKKLAHLLSNHLIKHSSGELDEETDEYEDEYEYAEDEDDEYEYEEIDEPPQGKNSAQ